jgi:uncharacterized membrane protein YcfT
MVKLNTGLKVFSLFEFAQTETARIRTNRKNISNDSNYFYSFRSIAVLATRSGSGVREMSLAMFSSVELYPARVAPTVSTPSSAKADVRLKQIGRANALSVKRMGKGADLRDTR